MQYTQEQQKANKKIARHLVGGLCALFIVVLSSALFIVSYLDGVHGIARPIPKVVVFRNCTAPEFQSLKENGVDLPYLHATCGTESVYWYFSLR